MPMSKFKTTKVSKDGRWHPRFSACSRCGKRDYPYDSAGLCYHCRYNADIAMAMRKRAKKRPYPSPPE